MQKSIAIHPDRVVQKNGEVQSFSARWLERAEEYGIQTELVDAHDSHVMERLACHDAFMWRFPPDANVRMFAQGFLHAVESGLGKRVFPDWLTRWHAEDKIAQTCMFRSLGMPTPETHIFWEYEEAVEYLSKVQYPLVLKLSSGYQSSNVRRLNNFSEALYYAKQLFGPGLTSLGYAPAGRLRRGARNLRRAAHVLKGDGLHTSDAAKDIHRGYMYLQELIGGNVHDTRITVIGERALGYIRRNRPGDFRASGSGLVEVEPSQIDSRAVDIAFKLADKLNPQTFAIDMIQREGEIVLLELSLSYVAHYVRKCPGYWRRSSDTDRRIEWVDGETAPEDVIFDNFVESLAT